MLPITKEVSLNSLLYGKSLYKLADDILTKKLKQNPKYSIRKNYKRNLRKTMVHILYYSFEYIKNSNYWLPITLNEKDFSNPEKLAYITYKSFRQSISLLASSNVIDFKLGNKKLNPFGKIKDGELYSTPGYRSSIRINPLSDLYMNRSGGNTIVRYKNEKKEIIKEKFINDKTTDFINQCNREWGFQYNNSLVQYKRIFNEKNKSRGRYYSQFQFIPRKDRKKWLPPKFVENDFHASQLNILYTIITGDRFKLENGEYGDCYLEVCKNLNLPKEYRKLIKTFFLSILSSNRDKALKSIRFGLAKSGHLYSEILKQYPEDVVSKWINSKEPRIQIASYYINTLKVIPQSTLEFEKTCKTILSIQKRHNKFFQSNITIHLLKPERIIKSILETHKQIEPLLFNPSISSKITYLESIISHEVIKESYNQSIPVLAIHDAFYCSNHLSNKLSNIMYKSLYKICLSIRIKLIKYNNLLLSTLSGLTNESLRKVEFGEIDSSLGFRGSG